MNKIALFLVFVLFFSFFSGCVEEEKEEAAPQGRVTFEDLKVEFSGYPYYIEDVVTGGVISDFGSHYGVKANLTDNRFLKLAYYTCLTANNAMFSHSWLTFDGKKPGEREVKFRSWGIEETNGFYEARVFFIDTNLLLINCKLENPGRVSFHIDRDDSIAEEGMVNECNVVLYPLEKRGKIALDSASIIPPPLRPELANTVLGETVRVYRAIHPSFDFSLVGNSLVSEQPISEFYLVIGFTDDKSDAFELAEKGKEILHSHNPDQLYKQVVGDWKGYLNSLAPNDPKWNPLMVEAMTALRMNLYAPRGEMNYWGSVPSKVHYNFFWGWDTPFHALGYNHFDPDLAIENMLLQFEGLKPDGMLCHMLDDSLAPVSSISQPPVQGWIVNEIWKETKNETFLRQMYEYGSSYMGWFERERDADNDGLYEFHTPDETGWDDTPRYLPEDIDMGFVGSVYQTKIDSLDLNCWLYQYYKYLEDWAKILHKHEQSHWGRKASKLASLVESTMWNEEKGCWFDLISMAEEHEHVEILTPAIWFPAWVGLSNNQTRIERVIEEHLLNPDEFFGKYPIPTVAYNSKFYDHEGEGAYWRGQIWLITAYSAYDTLKEHSYEQEALELKNRLLSMMSTPEKGGIYENYDALTGEVGWIWTSRPDKTFEEMPSCFQFGWSSVFVIEMLTDDLY
ncbi:MAG TPA: hypothetical protein HA348_05590 [Thermoplasmata archaeon]|nr:hypothetical protein [Thermoplasmata archaeon]